MFKIYIKLDQIILDHHNTLLFINNIKNGKATDLDVIDTRILKASSPVLFGTKFQSEFKYWLSIYLNVGKLKGSHLFTKVIRKLILLILDLSQ